MLQNGDQVTFLATQEKAHEFFQRINMPVRPVRNALIVGGGAIAYYLSQELARNHVRVRIVERDPARCNVLAESLPEAQILNEDGSNRDFLLSEGLESTEAFVALTNIDEENVLLTLFAKSTPRASWSRRSTASSSTIFWPGSIWAASSTPST